jgi:chromosome segregation ATPase
LTLVPKDPTLEEVTLPSDVTELLRGYLDPKAQKAKEEEAKKVQAAATQAYIAMMERLAKVREEVGGLREDIGQIRTIQTDQFKELKTDFKGLASRLDQAETAIQRITAAPATGNAIVAKARGSLGSWVALAVFVVGLVVLNLLVFAHR